jgi:hypothetical protein
VECEIERRYNGPAGSANGGYTCGLVARLVGGPCVEVTLRRPPPLGRPLRVGRKDGGRVELLDGGELVADGVPAELDLDVPAPVTPEEAARASERWTGFEEHAFPTCFVCGPRRPEQDGLGIFAGAVEGRPGLVAAPWTPQAALAGEDGAVRSEFVWAALDCPGAFAVGFSSGRGETVLGRLRARVDRAPGPGEPCLVAGWPLGEEGRKLYAGTAVFTAAGELLAGARAVWIEPRV